MYMLFTFVFINLNYIPLSLVFLYIRPKLNRLK